MYSIHGRLTRWLAETSGQERRQAESRNETRGVGIAEHMFTHSSDSFVACRGPRTTDHTHILLVYIQTLYSMGEQGLCGCMWMRRRRRNCGVREESKPEGSYLDNPPKESQPEGSYV